MALTAIPNQPISFVPSQGTGCLTCNDPDDITAFTDDQTIRFQFIQDTCGQAQEIVNPGFDAGRTGWTGATDWTFSNGAACFEGTGAFPLPDALISGVPSDLVIGRRYIVQLVVDSLSGEGIQVNLGGAVSEVIVTPGTYWWNFVATSPTAVIIQPFGLNSAGCISFVGAWEQRTDIQVAIYAQADPDDPIEVFGPDENPELFSYSGQHVTFSYPASELEPGCYIFGLGDLCDEENIQSNVVAVVADECVKVRACMNGPGFGFAPGTVFDFAVHGKMTRPTYGQEEASVRGSSGRVTRYWSRRITNMTVAVRKLGETMHRFMSTLPMWDHVYLNDIEVIVAAGGYAPDYGDVYDMGGNATLTVEPQGTSISKALCGPIGEDCAPDTCDTAPLPVAQIFTSPLEGGFELFLQVVDDNGFGATVANWTVNGVPQTPVVVSGDGTYLMGEVGEGDTVTVTLTNADVCVLVMQGVVPIIARCIEPETVSFINTGQVVVGVNATSTRITLRSPSGLTTTELVTTGITATEQGEWCIWPSDAGGEITGHITEILLSGPTISDPMLVENLDLRRVSPAHFYFLAATFGQLEVVRWPLAPWTASVPGNIVINAPAQRLDQTTVNSLFNNLAPSIYGDTVIVINGGTSASPTGAAVTAVSDILTAGGAVVTN